MSTSSAVNGTTRKRKHHESSDEDDHSGDSSSSPNSPSQRELSIQNVYPCQDKPLKLVKREASSDYYDEELDEADDDDLDELIEDDDEDDDNSNDNLNEPNGLALAISAGSPHVANALALAFPGLAARVKVTIIVTLLVCV